MAQQATQPAAEPRARKQTETTDVSRRWQRESSKNQDSVSTLRVTVVINKQEEV